MIGAKRMMEYMTTVFGRIVADVKEYGIAVVTLLAYAVTVNLAFHAFCPLVIFCGLPCPGCGVTRAAVCLLIGRWQQAWQLSPMVFPIALAAVYLGWNRYLLGRKATGIKAIVVALLVLLVIVYGVRMYLYFPNRVPYVYTEDNMLARFSFFLQRTMYRLRM